MLKIYLTSVLIYMIIIFCETHIFKYNIYKNGWVDSLNKTKFMSVFCISAIPILRFFVIIMLIIMFIYPKDKFMEDHK